MRIGADAVGAVVQRAGLGLRQGDQLLDVVRRYRAGEGERGDNGRNGDAETRHDHPPVQGGLAVPSTGVPMPSGRPSTSTKATRAFLPLRLAQAWLVPRWTRMSPAFSFTVESSMS